MKFSDVMAYYDYKMINICRALHVSRGAVLAWKKKDHIPFKIQCVLEVVTKRQLKVDKGLEE